MRRDPSSADTLAMRPGDYEVEIRRVAGATTFPWTVRVVPPGGGSVTVTFTVTRLGARFAARRWVRRHARGKFEPTVYRLAP